MGVSPYRRSPLQVLPVNGWSPLLGATTIWALLLDAMSATHYGSYSLRVLPIKVCYSYWVLPLLGAFPYGYYPQWVFSPIHSTSEWVLSLSVVSPDCCYLRVLLAYSLFPLKQGIRLADLVKQSIRLSNIYLVNIT